MRTEQQHPHTLQVLQALFGAERAIAIYEAGDSVNCLSAHETAMRAEYERNSALQAEFQSVEHMLTYARCMTPADYTRDTVDRSVCG